MSSQYQVVTKLKFPDGTIIDGYSLSPEERTAFTEFAIHLAAPSLAQNLVMGFNKQKVNEKPSNKHDNLYFVLPTTLTAKEAARFQELVPIAFMKCAVGGSESSFLM